MRVAVVGPGAIGGLFGMRLALSGVPVTFIAHGGTLAALRSGGLTLVEIDGTTRHLSSVDVTDSMTNAGRHDVVLLTVKAQQVGLIAAGVRAMVGPGTMVVTMENGLPWWYFLGGYEGVLAGRRLRSADPSGTIAMHLNPDSVIGAVEYIAARHSSPTRVEAAGGSRLFIGELDGADSTRIKDFAMLLERAGFEPSVSPDIRREIWRKLLLNASFNPVSALTHTTIGEISRLAEGRRLILDLMYEIEAVARAIGVKFDVSPETRLEGNNSFASHKTSMLQDVESGHPAEVEALVGAVIELGKLVGVPTPVTNTVYALVKSLEMTLRTSQGRLTMQPA